MRVSQNDVLKQKNWIYVVIFGSRGYRIPKKKQNAGESSIIYNFNSNRTSENYFNYVGKSKVFKRKSILSKQIEFIGEKPIFVYQE